MSIARVADRSLAGDQLSDSRGVPIPAIRQRHALSVRRHVLLVVGEMYYTLTPVTDCCYRESRDGYISRMRLVALHRGPLGACPRQPIECQSGYVGVCGDAAQFGFAREVGGDHVAASPSRGSAAQLAALAERAFLPRNRHSAPTRYGLRGVGFWGSCSEPPGHGSSRLLGFAGRGARTDHSIQDPGPGCNLVRHLPAERSPAPRPSATSAANSAQQACPPATEKATSSSVTRTTTGHAKTAHAAAPQVAAPVNQYARVLASSATTPNAATASANSSNWATSSTRSSTNPHRNHFSCGDDGHNVPSSVTATACPTSPDRTRNALGIDAVKFTRREQLWDWRCTTV